jgi:hypothetical protein
MYKGFIKTFFIQIQSKALFPFPILINFLNLKILQCDKSLLLFFSAF